MTFPAEDDFHRLLDSLTLCVLLHDADTKAIVWANRAACEALGYTVEELLPLKARDMTRPDPKYARENAIAAMDRAQTHGPQVYEWCYRSRRGEDMPSEAIATHVKLREGAVVMVQFRDISAQARMLEYAGRYNAMGEMAIAIAHELSQPLAAIRNFIEGTIQRLAAPGQLDGAIWGLRAADRQAEHAAAIIGSVRDYVARREPNFGVAELGSIISEVAYFVGLRARDANVAVTIEPPAEQLAIDCERVLIGQVILNLAFNAIDALMAAPEGARRLTIGAVRDGDEAMMHVRDNGPGLPEGTHMCLFDGFSSSKPTGNGIGLSLCKNIVTRHGGQIRAFPAQGGGLDCRFWLPLHRNDAQHEDVGAYSEARDAGRRTEA